MGKTDDKKIINYRYYIEKIEEVGEIGQDFDYRYSLRISYKNILKNKNVLVIMRNPSTADLDTSDLTVNNVLEYCKDAYSQVFIVNLYPHRDSDSNSVTKFYNSQEYDPKMQTNLAEIKKLVSEVEDVIVAWGSSQKYSAKIQQNEKQIINLIIRFIESKEKKLYAMRFVQSTAPWHPLNWKQGFNLELYNWNTN